MTKLSLARPTVFLLLAFFVLGQAGCWNPFAPDSGDPVPREPATYRDRESPEDVLHNLVTAYEWKNADEYLDCLSEDFVFYSSPVDVTADPTFPEYWYKDTERTIHTNMFADGSEVETISLQLTTAVIDSMDPSVPGDPKDKLYEEGVVLRVNVVGDLTYLAQAPSEFYMRVDQDQEGPNGEIWWEIYTWRDDPDGDSPTARANPDGNEELMTVGALKKKFME